VKTFQDSAGRTWSVSIHIDAVKRVRDLVGVDLLEAVGGKLLDKLTTDPVLLCDVLFALCKEEADTRGVTDVEFGKGLAGDAIDGATTAFLEELVSFFPKGRRGVLAKVIKKLGMVQSRVIEAAETRLDSPELEAEIEQAITQTLDLPKRHIRGQELPAIHTTQGASMAARPPGCGLSSGKLPGLPALPQGD